MEVRIEVTGNLKLFALDEADGYTQGRLPQLVLQLLLELLGRYSGFVINLWKEEENMFKSEIILLAYKWKWN